MCNLCKTSLRGESITDVLAELDRAVKMEIVRAALADAIASALEVDSRATMSVLMDGIRGAGYSPVLAFDPTNAAVTMGFANSEDMVAQGRTLPVGEIGLESLKDQIREFEDARAAWEEGRL